MALLAGSAAKASRENMRKELMHAQVMSKTSERGAGCTLERGSSSRVNFADVMERAMCDCPQFEMNRMNTAQ